MKYNPRKHHRKSIRLKGYDYSQAGAYFVTICAQNRECLSGDIINGKMQLNTVGKMVCIWWNRLTQKYSNVELDEYIIMPNHVHGIIIVGADPRVCPGNHNAINVDQKDNHRDSQENISSDQAGSQMKILGEHAGSPLQKPVSLSRMIQWFKTMTTNEYIRNVKQNDWHPFNKLLWQRNYYEHIIRDEQEINRIRKYIIENTLNWDLDNENPNNMETN